MGLELAMEKQKVITLNNLEEDFCLMVLVQGSITKVLDGIFKIGWIIEPLLEIRKKID